MVRIFLYDVLKKFIPICVEKDEIELAKNMKK